MNESFHTGLRQILQPAEFVETDAAANMLIDERQQFQGRALAVLAPKTVKAVSNIIRLCHEYNVAVVPQGGNTGYCGGATPNASGEQVVLSLTQLNTCRALDVNGRTITVDAGMVLADLQQIADKHGLLFPLSMGSEGSCQIGGNLSTNAGGLAVLRYGTARDLVLGLEVVLPNGEILDELKVLRKDTTGYDLKQLFIGAEGSLGVITAASLKLYPKPTANVVAWLALPTQEVLAPLLACLQSVVGDAVSSFEYVSRISLEYVLKTHDSAREPLDGRGQHYALVEFAGFSQQADFSNLCQHALAEAMTQEMAIDAVVAMSAVQAKALWYLRENIPRAEKLLGGSIKHDVSAPISRMAPLMSQLTSAVSEIDNAARLSIYGHVGDGNVHFNVLPPCGTDFATYKRLRGAQISRVIHDLAMQQAGSFSAEHGVGQLKLDDLERYAGSVQLHTMQTIKRALDPKNIMNPGKVLRV